MNKQHVSLTPEMKKDPVMDCYIALFHAITDPTIINPNKKVDSRKYLKGLFNEEESQKRIKQIDLMRSIGMKTEAETRFYSSKPTLRNASSFPSTARVGTGIAPTPLI